MILLTVVRLISYWLHSTLVWNVIFKNQRDEFSANVNLRLSQVNPWFEVDLAPRFYKLHYIFVIGMIVLWRKYKFKTIHCRLIKPYSYQNIVRGSTISILIEFSPSRRNHYNCLYRGLIGALFKRCKRTITFLSNGIKLVQNTYTQIATFMGPTWGPPGSCRPHVGPILAP